MRVDVVGEQPDYRELPETPELTISTVETEQTDWFDLGVMVTVAGRKIPFGDIFKALSKGQKKLLLVDKTYLSLEQPVFDKLRELVDEAMALQDRGSGELQISRYQAGLWAEFEELAEDTEQEARRLESAIDTMRVSIDDMLSHGDLASASEHRDILETYRMFAEDRPSRSWGSRLQRPGLEDPEDHQHLDRRGKAVEEQRHGPTRGGRERLSFRDAPGDMLRRLGA